MHDCLSFVSPSVRVCVFLFGRTKRSSYILDDLFDLTDSREAKQNLTIYLKAICLHSKELER